MESPRATAEAAHPSLILQAQSREEILADKIIALALRENRVKYRDLWDISWLTQQGVELPVRLIPLKVGDHQRERGEVMQGEPGAGKGLERAKGPAPS